MYFRSEEHEELRKRVYIDLEEIRDLIVKVLAAHRQVANAIRVVVGTTPQRGLVPDVRSRLNPAWDAINAVKSQLYIVADRLGPVCQTSTSRSDS
jgi:hypothetical protein